MLWCSEAKLLCCVVFVIVLSGVVMVMCGHVSLRCSECL